MSDPEEFQSDGDEQIQSMIGHQLRSLYDSVLNEPIPESIISLLTQLDSVSLNDDGHNSLESDGDTDE